MDHRLPATREMAQEFSELFVNRRAYTIQSMRPHPESGRHYYYRPKPRDGGEPVALTIETVRRHLAGELTIGIYAINPATQRCKWMAIDADYKTALEDLIKVQRQLQDDGIEAALEKSRRGGHLWILFETPVLAREARIYIYHVAGKLNVYAQEEVFLEELIIEGVLAIQLQEVPALVMRKLQSFADARRTDQIPASPPLGPNAGASGRRAA